MATAERSDTARSSPETLTRERVVGAALAVVDAEGLPALTMRRLGVELGVEAMSLYNHVQDKDDLLDGVVALLWEEIAAAVAFGGTWREDVRSFAVGVRQVAQRHPAAFPLTLERGLLPPRALDLTEGLLESLGAAGFDGVVDEAVRTVVGYTAGHILSELAWYDDRDATDRGGGEPDGAAAVGGDARGALLACDCRAQFRFGLDVLLDGLGALRVTG